MYLAYVSQDTLPQEFRQVRGEQLRQVIRFRTHVSATLVVGDPPFAQALLRSLVAGLGCGHFVGSAAGRGCVQLWRAASASHCELHPFPVARVQGCLCAGSVAVSGYRTL